MMLMRNTRIKTTIPATMPLLSSCVLVGCVSVGDEVDAITIPEGQIAAQLPFRPPLMPTTEHDPMESELLLWAAKEAESSIYRPYLLAARLAQGPHVHLSLHSAALVQVPRTFR